MTLYRYEGWSNGQRVKGMTEGSSPEQVAAQLQRREILPLTIHPHTPVARGWGLEKIWHRRPTNKDLMLFSRQMAALTRSGVPLTRAFQGLRESSTNRVWQTTMDRILSDLQGGKDLSSAMAEQGTLFDTFFIRTIQVGEETGRLDEAFEQIYRYLESGHRSRQRIRAAIRYPLFVTVTILMAMGVITFYIVPGFQHLFAAFRTELPWATRLLFGLARLGQDHLTTLLSGAALAMGGLLLSRRNDAGRLFWDRVLLKIPLLGDLLHQAILARQARLFVLASRSGMNIVQILSAMIETTDNRYLASRMDSLRAGVSRGESLVQSARRSGIFPSLALQMIGVGEETGRLEEMFSDLADYYEQEVDEQIQTLSSRLEPILLLVLSVMVLILALGLFLPLWTLGAEGLRR